MAVCVDITRDRQREKVIRKSEERFRLIANAAPGIVWAANAVGEDA